MKRSILISLHGIYWLLYLFLTFILFQTAQHHEGFIFPGWTFINVLGSSALVPAIIGFYTFYGYLFPKYLKEKRFYKTVLFAIAICFFGVMIEDTYLTLVPGPGIRGAGMESAIGISVILFVVTLLNGALGFILKGFVTWFDDIQLKEELNRKNYETELALIKSQINPHFLFNTINNIDTLIEVDAGKASKYLNKLSDIMRFMLYETKTEKIPFEQELQYIEKYIELQKIRTSTPNYVIYSISGDAEPICIAPMLFIPFIENAFKHAENVQEENAIRIVFECSPHEILFTCENRYLSPAHAPDKYNGLGNKLIQKRLTLLLPDKHTLKVENQNGIYKVRLSINLHGD